MSICRFGSARHFLKVLQFVTTQTTKPVIIFSILLLECLRVVLLSRLSRMIDIRFCGFRHFHLKTHPGFRAEKHTAQLFAAPLASLRAQVIMQAAMVGRMAGMLIKYGSLAFG